MRPAHSRAQAGCVRWQGDRQHLPWGNATSQLERPTPAPTRESTALTVHWPGQDSRPQQQKENLQGNMHKPLPESLLPTVSTLAQKPSRLCAGRCKWQRKEGDCSTWGLSDTQVGPAATQQRVGSSQCMRQQQREDGGRMLCKTATTQVCKQANPDGVSNQTQTQLKLD